MLMAGDQKEPRVTGPDGVFSRPVSLLTFSEIFRLLGKRAIKERERETVKASLAEGLNDSELQKAGEDLRCRFQIVKGSEESNCHPITE